MNNKICFITGVGVGTGAAIARRFAKGGYYVVMVARNEQRLLSLENELPNSHSISLDLSDLDKLTEACERVKKDIGVPNVIVHNAVRATFDTFLEGKPEELEQNFRVNTTSLLYLARAFTPEMIERGSGAIAVTGNTAAFRGVPNYALFSPTKAAQRNLSQALARDLGPRGIHVSYFNIDAVIDVPWTRDRFHPDKPEEFFIKPVDIAEEVFHITHQPRSAWSFDVEIRPFAEKW